MASARVITALRRTGARNTLLLPTYVSTQWTLQTASRAHTHAATLRTLSTSVRLAQQKQDNNKNDLTAPPPTSLGASETTVGPASAVPDPIENIQSIEDLIRELNKDPSLSAQLAQSAQEDEKNNYSDSQGEHQQEKKKQRDWSSWRKSKFWYYLWVVFYWSCLGSLPIHLMMINNETKSEQEKLEWKIAVLQDMRDKLVRGESIEEEEALLKVGLDRSKREKQHQVDDQMFEDLIKSAEKLDMEMAKGFQVPIGGSEEVIDTQAAPVPTTPAPVAAPQSTVPRKPSPPKSERSFL